MQRVRSAVFLVLSALVSWPPATALAQSGRPEMIRETHHDVSPPLRELPPGPRRVGDLEAEPVRRIPSSRNPSFGPDPVLQPAPKARLAPLAAPTAIVNFDGVGQGFTGPSGTFIVNSAPPDTNSAVGPNHVVEIVNTDFAVFDKGGTALYGPVPINTLWSGFGTDRCATENDGDPVVVYDRIADRWIISQFQVSALPFEQCVAVSTSPDPTGSYSRYSFSYTDGFPDYPKMGVWPDAYYITYNLFNNAGTAFLGTKVCAFDRARMLAGTAATQQCFMTSNLYGGLLPADLDGRTLPPAGAPNPIVALGATSTTLAFWKFHVDWTVPASTTFTGPTSVTVPAYTEACGGGTCIPQGGTTRTLDSLADRLMYRAAYRNFGDHESIVVNHAVTAGSSVGIRWYELRGVTTTPTLFQSSTFAPDANYRWMGSAAMDQAGNIAIGYSLSSSALKPQIRVTGRLAGDPAGTLTAGETTIVAGAGSQTGTLTRWGDYSSMSIDPVDDCTFYYATEYIPANGSFNWRTRIAAFKLTPCGDDFSLSPSPATLTLAAGATGTSTITVTPTGAFAGTVALSISGVPAGASASFAPASTTSTSVLTVDAGTAAPGTYPLTVTGTSGSLTHTTTVTLTIPSPPDFVLSASPASVSVAQGSSGTTTISMMPQNGFNGSVDLSVTGLPAGATGNFNPTPTASSSVLTLTIDTATPVGTYPLTVTGTSGALTHTTPVTLTVTAPPPPADFSLSALPTTVNAVQGGTGTSTISVAPQNGFNGQVTLSVSGLPSLATGAFQPVMTSTTSQLTLAADVATPTGTYTVTVTGTSGTLTHSTTVTFVVTTPPPPPTPSFSLSVSPSSLTVRRGSSRNYTVTITRTGSFTDAVTLSVTGLPFGVTPTFTPTTVTGTSSTLRVSASGNASRTTATITITGTSAGGLTATTTASLTIR